MGRRPLNAVLLAASLAALCRTIVESQQAEIRQMQRKLADLKGSS